MLLNKEANKTLLLSSIKLFCAHRSTSVNYDRLKFEIIEQKLRPTVWGTPYGAIKTWIKTKGL